jgi:hypothetical protein
MADDLVRPGGQITGADVPVAADMQRLDEQMKSRINYVGGGAYTLKRHLIFGGSGIALVSGGLSSSVRGGVKTRKGGRIILGDSDEVQLSPARTRSILMPILEARMYDGGNQFNPHWSDGVNIAASSPIGLKALRANALFSCPIPSRYLHQGATLALVTLRMRVGAVHSSIPSQRPSFIVARTDANGVGTVAGWMLAPELFLTRWATATAYAIGDVVQPTNANKNGRYYKCTTIIASSGGSEPTWPTTIGATVADGGGVWTCQGYLGSTATPPANVDAYYNAGQPQSLLFTPYANNVIDHRAYDYVLLITDENALAGNLYHSARFDFVNITDLRTP